MEIVLGTYEGPIISYGIKLSTNVDLEPQFIEKSHSGCVKSIACNSRYLASGMSHFCILECVMCMHVAQPNMSYFWHFYRKF